MLLSSHLNGTVGLHQHLSQLSIIFFFSRQRYMIRVLYFVHPQHRRDRRCRLKSIWFRLYITSVYYPWLPWVWKGRSVDRTHKTPLKLLQSHLKIIIMISSVVVWKCRCRHVRQVKYTPQTVCVQPSRALFILPFHRSHADTRSTLTVITNHNQIFILPIFIPKAVVLPIFIPKAVVLKSE